MTVWYALLFTALPLIFLTSTSELFELNKMIVVYFLSVLVVTTLVAQKIVTKSLTWKRTPFDIPLLLFLAAQILSTIFSIHPHTSIFGYYSRWHGGLLSTFAYLALFYGFVQTFSAKQVKQFLFYIVLGGALASAYAIPEYFGISPSCTLIEIQDNADMGKSWSTTITGMGSNPSKFFTTSCWSERTNPKYRIFGTFGQPNWLAAYVIMLLPLIILLSLDKDNTNKNNFFSKFQILNFKFQKTQSRSRIANISSKKEAFPESNTQNLYPSNFSGSEPEKVSRVNTTLHIPHSTFSKLITTFFSFTYYLLPIALFSTLLFTRSRSGFLGFVVSMGLLIPGILFIHHAQKDKKKNSVNLYILYLISFISLALLFGTPFSPSLKQLLSSNSQQIVTQPIKDPGDLGGTDSGDIRKIVWDGAIEVWKRYPVLGSGVETFGYSYYLDRPIEHNNVSEWEYLYNKSHNELLNYLATTGIIGLSMYVLWQGWVYLILIKIIWDKRSSDFSKTFSLAVVASLTALHASNFFGFSTVTVSTLFYLLPAMAWLTTQTDQQIKQNHHSLLAWQQLSLLGLGVLAIIPLVQILALWQADYLFAKSQKELRSSNFTTAETLIKKAISLFPSEGAYYDQLGKVESEFAVALANDEEYELGGQKATEALDAANQMLLLNPYHLSFYRARVTILLTLAQAQPALYDEALKTVVASESLAPTDPKLPYTQGLIEQALDATSAAILSMQKAVDLKPDYESARWQLGQLWEMQGEIDKAIEQYQYMVDHIPTGNTPTVQERLEILQSSQSAKKN